MLNVLWWNLKMKSKPDLLYILVIILGLGIAISSYAGAGSRIDAQEVLAQSTGHFKDKE